MTESYYKGLRLNSPSRLFWDITALGHSPRDVISQNDQDGELKLA